MLFEIFLIILSLMVIGFSVVNLVYYFRIYNSDTDTGVSKNNAMMMIILNIITIIASVILIIIMALRFPRSKEIMSSNLGKNARYSNSEKKESPPNLGKTSSNSEKKEPPSNLESEESSSNLENIPIPSNQGNTESSSNSGNNHTDNLLDIIYRDHDQSITNMFLSKVHPKISLDKGEITKNNLSDSDIKRINNTDEGSQELLDFLNIKLNFLFDRFLLEWNENYTIEYKNKTFKFEEGSMIGLNSKLEYETIYKFLDYIESLLPDKKEIKILTIDDLNNIENIDFENLEILLFPFKNTLADDQWILLVIDLKNNFVGIVDPLFEESRREKFENFAKDIIKDFKSLGKTNDEWKIEYTTYSRNKNINDTGVSVVWTTVLLMLATDKPYLAKSIILCENSIIWYRTIIAKVLLEMEYFKSEEQQESFTIPTSVSKLSSDSDSSGSYSDFSSEDFSSMENSISISPTSRIKVLSLDEKLKIENTQQQDPEILIFLGINFDYSKDKILMEGDETYVIKYNEKILKDNDFVLGLNNQLTDESISKFLNYVYSKLEKDNLKLVSPVDVSNILDYIHISSKNYTEEQIKKYLFNKSIIDIKIFLSAKEEKPEIKEIEKLFSLSDEQRKLFLSSKEKPELEKLLKLLKLSDEQRKLFLSAKKEKPEIENLINFSDEEIEEFLLNKSIEEIKIFLSNKLEEENIDFLRNISGVFELKYSKFTLPYNRKESSHWVLINVDLDNKSISIEDSLYYDNNKTPHKIMTSVSTMIKLVLNVEIPEENFRYVKGNNQAKETVDCGVFTAWNSVKFMLKNEESELSDKIVLNSDNIVWYRTVLAKTIIELNSK